MPSHQSGVTLIELMITLAIFALLLVLGLPSYAEWLQNQRVRTSAESILSGLQLARTEAVRRNAPVRFQFVSTLTAACALSSTAANWIVSRASPVGNCGAAASETTSPQILGVSSAAEGGGGATVSNVNPAGATTVVFNGMGRVSNAGAITQFDIRTATSTRNLRLQVNAGGLVRLCDPAVTDTSDPRRC